MGRQTIQFPVYICSKGRPDKQLTAAALLRMGVRPTLVVEAAEDAAYAEHNPDCDVLVWPQEYMDGYERTPELDPHPTFGAAKNFAWDHARDAGFLYHWVMDDNIRLFYIKNDNGHRQKVGRTQTPFVWHEQFALKWKNLAGLCLVQAAFLGSPGVPSRHVNPMVFNTRLYCATLLRTDLHEWGIRWRRGLNEDTITSIDILKTGYWCTAQSYALSIGKVSTGSKTRLDGGMTDFYRKLRFEGKASELVRQHPDCCRAQKRFNRIHHYCDYARFKQRLIPIEE